MLLLTEEFFDGIRGSIQKANNTLLITSAFIKEHAILKLLEGIDKSVKVEVVGRWRKHDVLMGASDLEVYRICKKNDWMFGVDLNLHGKLYLIDEADVYLGSANLTQNGMSIGCNGNLEFGTQFGIDQIDLSRINKYKRDEVFWLTDDAFTKMESDINNLGKDAIIASASHQWSEKILEQISTPIESLWVNELLFSVPKELLFPDLNNEAVCHDFELMNLHCDTVSEGFLKLQFRRTRVFNWLRFQLKSKEEVSFGALSVALHGSLFDDPLPYRKGVKEFLAVLFEWMTMLGDEFAIKKYNRTSTARLV